MLSQLFARKYWLVQNLKIDAGFYINLAVAVLFIPTRLLCAWLLAVAIHELSHYIALKLCGVSVYNIKFSAFGVTMLVGELNGWKELVCALSGPLGGMIPILLRRWMPLTAILGFLLSCFNLLPILSLDGGRALRTVAVMLFGKGFGNLLHRIISISLIVLIAFIVLYFSVRYYLALLIPPILFLLFVLNKEKFLANIGNK